ncbi:MAG: hypothetical protein Q9M36_08640 [Sulfurovum sp.]|nr:hypothetical protein [Sulfurovum sp.]
MKTLSIAVTIIISTSLVQAGFSSLEKMELELQAKKIRQELNISNPSPKDKRLDDIRRELKLDMDTSSKASLLGQDIATSVQSLVKDEDEAFTQTLSSMFTNVSQTLGIEEKEEEASSDILSLLGLRQKTKTPSLNIPVFTDIHDASTTLYQGMKYSGQSAQLMSGAMYNSSKVYNTMFELFDDSPFNIFEEEESDSIFDVFD